MTNNLHFDNDAARLDPYPLYARLREEAPIHWDEFEQGWLVTRYEDVEPLLQHRCLSSRADISFVDRLPEEVRARAEPLRTTFEHWMVFSDPPIQTKLRTLVRGHVARPTSAELEHALTGLADALVDDAAALGALSVSDAFAKPLGLCALSAVMGLSEAELRRADAWSNDLLDFINVEPSVEQTLRSLESLTELRRFVCELGDRTPSSRESLAGVLARAWREGTIDETEAVATFAQMITGALSPIPHAINNALLALIREPSQLHRLRSQPELLSTAVDETLRYDSPFLLAPRTVTKAFWIRDVEVQAGERIGLMIASANHDERVFRDPERLDIARRPNRHLTFGKGSHFCLGAHLTKTVLKVALSALLLRRDCTLDLLDGYRRRPLFGMRNVENLRVQLESGRRRVAPPTTATP